MVLLSGAWLWSCVHVNACHKLKHANDRFSFKCHESCVCHVWRIKKNKQAHSLPHQCHKPDGETLPLMFVKTVLQSSQQLWAEMNFFYPCYYIYVDFVIWSKCLFSFCMFSTLLKEAATAFRYNRSHFFSFVNHDISAESYSCSLYNEKVKTGFNKMFEDNKNVKRGHCGVCFFRGS